MVIVIIIPAINGPVSLVTKELLKAIIFCQYVPRIIRVIPLYKEVTSTSGILTETAWAGAALNLFLYMLASHVGLILHRVYESFKQYSKQFPDLLICK